MRTSDIRYIEHVRDAMQCKHKNIAIHKAIRKYGAENFMLEVLAESNSKDELCELEQIKIAELGTLAPRGYNLTVGGEGVHGLSEDAAKYRKAQQRKALDTPEHRKKLSDAALKRSDQISSALKDRWNDPVWRAATTEKIRLACAPRRKEKAPTKQKKTREQLNFEHSERMKKMHADHPERFKNSGSKGPQSEELKQKKREKMKEVWKDPEYRELVKAKRKIAMQSEEYRLHQSKTTKAVWEKRNAERANK
jgi:hypothetical protein